MLENVIQTLTDDNVLLNSIKRENLLILNRRRFEGWVEAFLAVRVVSSLFHVILYTGEEITLCSEQW